jgi:asparagine synthase (glutamine-hydrolysing)
VCGICGLVWRDRSRPAGAAEVETMNAAIYHRGPDDGGVFTHRQIALGHRRLSIIDLSEGGHQPMLSRDGSIAVIFNGEIYNFLELRDELRRAGREFVSSSDTEVLLASFEHWGPDCVSRFNGMWAFVVLDMRRNTLFASRDRFGIKPFHYVHDESRFAFASEAKALLAAFPDLRRPNEAMLRHFLPSGAVDDGPETFFDGVLQLEPGHNLFLDIATGALRQEKYWQVTPVEFAEKWCGGDPVETLRELLHSAVSLHMRADVPVGTCLSGGVDSSALVSMMTRLHPEKVQTFSGLYKGKDYDEEEFVKSVRNYTGCIGVDIRREPSGDLFGDLATITWHQDMPTAGPVLYTHFNVMESASRNVKVILDGQGADELFAGYLPYYAIRANDLLDAGNWQGAYGLMMQVLRHHGSSMLTNFRPRQKLGAALSKGMRAIGSLKRDVISEPPFFHEDFLSRTADGAIARTTENPYSDGLSNVLCNHLRTQSIPALLHYEDRNSMAFSIEARVPYLDYRLVEFALGLGSEYKIRDGWTKWVLRKAVEPILPANVAWRRSKMGYPTPAARWIKSGRDKEAARELLFSQSFLDREIISKNSVGYYWRQHQNGDADRSWLLYRYATVELWYRQYIDAFAPNPARPVPKHIASQTVSSTFV